MIGSYVGDYRVTGALGRGGMGEVWRAIDQTLDREVALKCLPATVAADAEALARLQVEARSLAALNHPQVATLYSLEKAQDRHFLVMELVEGEDLAERIARGRLPAAEAVEVARQIAEGLEAAHAKGIVHRDLKPGNIKVRNDGTVKILDFGLAKVSARRADESASFTHSPTRRDPMTDAGTVLGTAAYMAPEQAAGKPLDSRADLWAFGVVLWEMLTGRPLFTGGSLPELLASVLREEPNFGELPDDLDPRLRHLLELCLRRDPKRRLQAIGDARVALEDLLESPWQVGETRQPPAASRSAVIINSTALVLLLAAGWWWLDRSSTKPSPVSRRATYEMVEAADVGLLSITNPRISPDGRRVAYVGEDEDGFAVYLRSLESLVIRKVEGTEAARWVCFSPDGGSLGYWDSSGRYLARVPIDGGLPTVLADPGYVPAVWDAGYVYYTPGRVNTPTLDPALRSVWRVSVVSGEAEQLSHAEGEESHMVAAVVDGGKTVLFSVGNGYEQELWNVALLDVDSGDRSVLLEGVNQPTLVGSERLVYWNDGRLHAVDVDLDGRRTLGHARPVLDGVLRHPNAPVEIGQFHLGPRGDLVYVDAFGESIDLVSELVLRSIDGGERRVIDRGEGWLHTTAEFSPDGRRIAIARVHQNNRDGEIWLVDLDSGSKRVLATEARYPVWSKDGETLFYAAMSGSDPGTAAMVSHRLAGVAETISGRGRIPSFALADGTLIWQSSADDDFRYGLTDAEGEDRWLTQRGALPGTLSPDERWLVFPAGPTLLPELYVVDLSSRGSSPMRLGGLSGRRPRFSPDGRYLFLRVSPWLARAAIHRAPVSGEGTFSVGPPEPVLETAPTPRRWVRGVDCLTMTLDGESLVLAEVTMRGQGGRIVFVENWISTLDGEIAPPPPS